MNSITIIVIVDAVRQQQSTIFFWLKTKCTYRFIWKDIEHLFLHSTHLNKDMQISASVPKEATSELLTFGWGTVLECYDLFRSMHHWIRYISILFGADKSQSASSKVCRNRDPVIHIDLSFEMHFHHPINNNYNLYYRLPLHFPWFYRTFPARSSPIRCTLRSFNGLNSKY